MRRDLSQWEFRASDGRFPWLPAEAPGHVHRDLMRAGVIADPFARLQELGVQWVDETDWEYRTSFEADAPGPGERQVLRFEGLDTICRLHLNGAQVAESRSMFVPLEVDVTGKLKDRNELLIQFRGPRPAGRALLAAYMKEQGLKQGTAGLEDRSFVRKAQYQFGWDWGPRLAGCGIWKPAALQQFQGRILDVWIRPEQRPDGAWFLHLSGRIEGAGTLRHIVTGPKGEEWTLEEGAGQILIREPELWWPNGQGEQPLYTVSSELVEGGEVLDRKVQKVGLRTIQLRRQPDQFGESFEFIVNGRPIWCMGANWIPDSSFPAEITRERLEGQLLRAQAMNVNMLRVWGGGIFESDDFYDLCDKLGIMVWQDFPYACSYSPDTAEWRQAAVEEAEANVPRLRNRASLAVWCGNNENTMMWEGKWGGSENTAPRFHGEVIWETTIPDALSRLDPTRPYIPTSPTGPAGDCNGDGKGDQHYWDVWHGRGDWIHYRESGARFCSEFGFASSMGHDAWASVLGPDDESPFSDAVKWHDKTGKGWEKFLGYVGLHYPEIKTLDDLVYFTQLNQRDAMRFAMGHFRTSEFCRGALIWQFNDCWPVVSWALIDGLHQLKAAGEEMERCFAPAACFILQLEDRVEIWAVNHGASSLSGSLQVRVLDCQTGAVEHEWEIEEVSLEPGQRLMASSRSRAELGSGSLVFEGSWGPASPAIQLLQEPKDTAFGDAVIHHRALPDGIELWCEGAPVVDLMLRSSSFDRRWVTLLPGRAVKLAGAHEGPLHGRSLAGEHAIIPARG